MAVWIIMWSLWNEKYIIWHRFLEQVDKLIVGLKAQFFIIKKNSFFFNISNRLNSTAIGQKTNPRRCASVSITKKPIFIGLIINLEKNCPHKGRNIPCGRLLVCLQCHPRMTYPQFMEGCNVDLTLNDQIPYRVWSRRAAQKSGSRTRMLHSYDGDGWPPLGYEHRRTPNSDRACWKAWRDTSQRLQPWLNDQDWYPRQPNGPPSTYNFPQRKSGCVCLEPWRHAGNRPFSHGVQTECVTLLYTYLSEEAGIRSKMRSSNSGRGSQATRRKFHQGGLLPWLAGKCGDGQKSQREMEDMHRLHRPKQGMP